MTITFTAQLLINCFFTIFTVGVFLSANKNVKKVDKDGNNYKCEILYLIGFIMAALLVLAYLGY